MSMEIPKHTKINKNKKIKIKRENNYTNNDNNYSNNNIATNNNNRRHNAKRKNQKILCLKKSTK